MKKKLIILILLIALAFVFVGCKKEEPPITNNNESTIIKNAKTTDEYIKKKDYKSIAYAYIYSLKEGTTSYEAATTGTISAKVLFIDYVIDYSSTTIKRGSTYFTKDNSVSPLMTVQNEFYMVNDEKILVSKDLKKYEVYNLSDFQKISYSVNQYTVMGYVFNNESIKEAELVSDLNDQVSIKYTLDNELSTNLVKVDMKNSGGLSSFPTFSSIEITLTMKKDFTPVSYSINAVYEASKALLGTTVATQKGECVINKVNQDVVISNEQAYIDKLGQAPTIIDNKEKNIKDGLIDSILALDFKNGTNIDGSLTIDIMESKCVLDLSTSLSFDIEKISEEKLYELLKFNANLKGNEIFNSLIGIIESFASDSLGDYSALLESFSSIKVIYDGNGALYLIAFDEDEVCYYIGKVKLVDLLDAALSNINIIGLLSDSDNDLVTFERIDGANKDTYRVEVILNDDTINSIKEGIDSTLSNAKYSMIKTLLGYKGFDSIKTFIDVENGKVKKLESSFNYLKKSEEGDSLEKFTFIKLVLETKPVTVDFDNEKTNAESLYNAYLQTIELNQKINELYNNVYVSSTYIVNANKVLEDYNKLSDDAKTFTDSSYISSIEGSITKVSNILAFYDTLFKYDLDNVTNEDIYALLKSYSSYSIDSTLLRKEIGDEKVDKLTSLSSSIDYSLFDSALAKIKGTDESEWGLTEDEILGTKLILDISKIDSYVSSNILLKMLIAGSLVDATTLEAKINTLITN